MKNSDRFWNIIDNADSFSVRGYSDEQEFGWASKVNQAFAIELYIKAIMEYEKENVEKGHNLKTLFKHLKNKTQDTIYDYWRKLAGENIPDNEQSKLYFEDNLYACCNVFEKFRYVHEWAGQKTEFDRYSQWIDKNDIKTKKMLTAFGEDIAKLFKNNVALETSWNNDQWEKLSIFSPNHEFGRSHIYDSFLSEFEKAIKQYIKQNVIPNLPQRSYDIKMSSVVTTTIKRADGSIKTESKQVVVPMNIVYTIKVDVEKLTSSAKRNIKEEFDVDIEFEFVRYEYLRQRFVELSKKYDVKIEEVLGIFIPATNNLPPIIIVGYDENNPIECIRIYHFQLYSAMDYFEVLKELGDDFLRVLSIF